MPSVCDRWEGLSQSARASVLWWIRRLSGGQTFRVSFDCSETGVRGITEEVVIERHEDGSRQIRVRTYTPGDLEDETELAGVNRNG